MHVLLIYSLVPPTQPEKQKSTTELGKQAYGGYSAGYDKST